MRKLLSVILAIVCLLGVGSITLANSGQAILPHWFTYSAPNSTTWNYICLSNITNAPISVTITLFKNDGSIFKDDNSRITGLITAGAYLDYNEDPSNATVSFTLAPNSTGMITINSSISGYTGYGIIGWNQASNAVHGLVAYSKSYAYASAPGPNTDSHSIPINGGLPF